ncbi:hypothetical protein FIM58_01255 [Helicobacter pylori]|uniref:hypothetical protein n=1 Tax=Helicobacter pylori TaxID=210 RepID=UPI00112C5FC2|nr:hypothetical protein [Helicobacter pylori]TPH70835.1 hypothetical protein FIM58_01255 [Helicobacter pylori]
MLSKLIHMGAEATLKIFEIFPRLVREFVSHSMFLIIGILQSLISNAFALCSSKGVTFFLALDTNAML